MITLQETNISYLGKRKNIFKNDLVRDMLVSQEGSFFCLGFDLPFETGHVKQTFKQGEKNTTAAEEKPRYFERTNKVGSSPS